MGLAHDLLHDVAVKRQVVTLCLVTAFVVAFELALYLFGVVPMAQEAVRGMLHRASAERGVRRSHAAVTADAWLALGDLRERRLIEANNAAARLRGVLIVLAPLLIVVILFLSSRPLRESPLHHVYLEVGLTVLVLSLFQVAFFRLGQRWEYPTEREMVHRIAEQYRADCAADGDSAPRADPRIAALLR